MTEQVKYSGFFIELDVIFDTRLATLFSISEDAVKLAFDTGYHTRYNDDFKGIEIADYNKAYELRDKHILKNAVATPIMKFLQEFVITTTHQISTSPFHLYPKVIINTYPYKLTTVEEHVIIASMVGITRGDCDVELVHMPYEEITPAYVNDYVSVMVMYEYYKWLEIHSANGNLKVTSCPNVGLIGPAIFFKAPDKQRLKSCEKIKMTPFEAMEKIAAPLIGLQLLPIEYFSIALKLKPATTTS